MLSARGLSRAFGKIRALNNVHLDVEQGEVHAVVGANGAGKSTLMAILSGQIRPDEGEVLFQGKALPLGCPREIKALGLAMVHQHFMLAAQMTVLENLVLDQLGCLHGLTDPKSVQVNAGKAAKNVDWEISFGVQAGSLPVGAQQRVEILKALCANPEVIILDEPTAVLTPGEVEDLIRVLKELKQQGKTVILIAHKLKEVYAVADRVTVLRQGRNAGSGLLSEIDPKTLAGWMVGESPAPLSPPGLVLTEVLLEARSLAVQGDRGESAVREVSFAVRSGEILGIGGVDGNGQTELAEAAAGVRQSCGGSLHAVESPAFIPPDRQVDGLALSMSTLDNLLIAGISSQELVPRGLMNSRSIRSWGEGLINQYRIKADSLDTPVKNLSGGNQQKVVVSRALSRDPRVIIAVNPTRGLDISASRFVHDELLKAAGRGAAILLVSTDREELAALAHRVLVMSQGKLMDAIHDSADGGLLSGVVT